MKKILLFSIVLVLVLMPLIVKAAEYYQSIGYGRIVAIENDSVTLYDYSAVSLQKVSKVAINNDSIFVETPIGVFLNTVEKRTKDSLILKMEGEEYAYIRIDTLPTKQYSDTSTDPESSFEILWNTYNENCILFDVARVDWEKTYEDFRPKVNNNTSDSELIAIFQEMLKPLNDGHTMVADIPCGPIKGLEWLIYRDYLKDIINKYFIENSIIYGKDSLIEAAIINENTGYLAVNSFCGYSRSDSSEYLGFKTDLDYAISKIKNTKNIIVDLRFNGGGLDQLSFELVSRFNKTKKIGYYKQVKLSAEGELSPKECFYLNANTPSLADKKVYVLVGQASASAADVCAMLFKNIPEITVIGETSYGIFSDMLVKTLPNGLIYSMSNEKYVDENHVYYEQKGIEPEIEILPDWDKFVEGSDVQLDSILQMIDNKTSVADKNIENSSIMVINHHNNIELSMKNIETGNYKLTVYDITGRPVLHKFISISENEHLETIDNMAISKGSYIGLIEKTSKKMTFKFVK